MHDKIGDARETFSGFSISLSSLFVINLKLKKKKCKQYNIECTEMYIVNFFQKR